MSAATTAAVARPNLILATCCLSLLLVSLDATVVNIALPAIRQGLHIATSGASTGLQWTIDGYTVVVACLLMLSGSLADRFGRRRVFQLGLGVFCLGSLLCSLAPSVPLLVAARLVQALGGSMMNPVAMSIIVQAFPDPRARARAIGVWGSVAGLSFAIGPLVGGTLTHLAGWRSIFWINLPMGAAAMLLSALVLPESRSPRPRRLDPLGQLAVVLTLGPLIGALIEGQALGWGAPPVVGLFALSAASLLALLAVEPRQPEPLVDLRYFRSVPFTGAALVAVCAFASLGAFLFLTTLYLQEARGLSAVRAGIATLPMALCAMIGAPLSGRLVARRGARLPMMLAGLATALGALVLTRVETATGLPILCLAYALIGTGFGLVNAPISNAAVSGMPRERAGVAAAIASTSRQVGVSLGVAVAGAMLGTVAPAALAAASQGAWMLVAGCGTAIMLLGLVCNGAWGRRTAQQVAARLGAT